MAQNLAWGRGAMVALSHLCTSSNPGLLWGWKGPQHKDSPGGLSKLGQPWRLLYMLQSCLESPQHCVLSHPATHTQTKTPLPPCSKHTPRPELARGYSQDTYLHGCLLQCLHKRNPPLWGIRAFG